MTSKTSSTMKLLLAGIILILIVEANAQWHKFPRQAAQGTRDMWRAYRDMRKANYIGADKYFHARGNYDAAKRGAGGRFAARVISDARELSQSILRRGNGDSEADQVANRWGRSGKNPNAFRPAGLPSKY